MHCLTNTGTFEHQRLKAGEFAGIHFLEMVKVVITSVAHGREPDNMKRLYDPPFHLVHCVPTGAPQAILGVCL